MDSSPSDKLSILIPQAEDRVLVGLVCCGSREAFDEIDHRYRSKLRRFLARHATDPEHADDLAQRTLIRAFTAMPTLREADKLSGWLYQIAFRLAVDESRKKPPSAVALGTAKKLIDPKTVSTERAEDDENLWSTAEKVLTPDEYGALWLKYVDAYKVDAIAKIMGRTKISVRVLLFRARKKLLAVLSKEK